MAERFCYSVATELARDHVWQIFADIANWRRVPGIYDDLKWAGEPWLPGSRIVGEHNHLAAIKFHYVIKSCAPPESVRFIAHGLETGFATERTISFECLDARTRIKVDSYTVGTPTIQLPEGVQGFIRDATVRFWDAFAHFCDAQLLPPVPDGTYRWRSRFVSVRFCRTRACGTPFAATKTAHCCWS